MREYTLIVKGKRIPVTHEVYKTYYQEYEHERYLKNKTAQHEHSLEQFVEAGVSIEFNCLGSSSPVEDEVLKAEQINHLHCCLDKLNAEEQSFLKIRQKNSWTSSCKYLLQQSATEKGKF